MQSNKIRFVTLYPEGANYSLKKDVGQIPYSMYKYCGMDATIASRYIDLEGEYLEFVQGLKFERTSCFENKIILSGCLYLLKNSRKIDWLNIYHCRKGSLIWTKLFKKLNPKGKVYLKLDAGFLMIEKLKKEPEYCRLFDELCENVDVVSAESDVVVAGLQKYTDARIAKIPNGFGGEKADDALRQVKRENCFITVARIGAPEKNNDLLLEAFAKIADKNDWKLYMVGKVEKSFEGYVSEYFVRYPHLKDRVIFTGEVADAKELAKLYRMAKVFVLPSEFESFSLATVEAMSNGCRLILSNQVAPCIEFTRNGRYGTITDDTNLETLIKAMEDMVEEAAEETIYKEIEMYANEKFSWENIALQLKQEMEQLC